MPTPQQSVALYDSARQKVVEFVPVTPGQVSMYVCGPTVQSQPHVGHLRAALVYDLWSRWFRHRGFAVTMVRNVTDIDDKILQRADEEGLRWWALAAEVEAQFHQATSALRISRPTLEPRATGDIPAMVELIQLLLDRGHAYVAEDGSGDVYFDVASWPDYGQLTRQQPSDLVAADEPRAAKRSAHDFALWKGHKDSEPASAQWPAPWGPGRPGWHLECSAMSTRYLGAEFDIHGGGLDLRFPHHENELAQSAAAGYPFARQWIHSGLVTVSGQKMSKSLGNSIFALDWLASTSPIVIRYGLSTAHYRSDLDVHPGFLDEAAAAFNRIEAFLQRSTAHVASSAAELPAEFVSAMNDDLAIPQALAIVHERVRLGNLAVDAGDGAVVGAIRGELIAMLEVLGLNPESTEWDQLGQSGSDAEAIGRLVGSLLASRDKARDDREFGVADAIRNALDEGGIDVVDTAEGPRWSIRGNA